MKLNLFRSKRELLPPQDLLINIASNPDNFRVIGAEFFRYFVELCRLQPDERVLDVGCGIGRMAVPLTRYLSNKGSYEGFDVCKSDIQWCKSNITPRYKRFRFQTADIRNTWYNPSGSTEAAHYTFPFGANTFDFAFATSVLTHLEPDAAQNYLGEVERTLRPGGRALVTFFLINAESKLLIAQQKSTQKLKSASQVHFVQDPAIPELATGLDESFVRCAYERAGLVISNTFYGDWCGRAHGLSYQDVVIAFKPAEVDKK
jgi:ubiquinone/menaquinone biosynthesis C-methylase UbiE